MWHCHYGAGLRSFNPGLRVSTVSLSISAFGKQFLEYLYSFVFWLNIQKPHSEIVISLLDRASTSFREGRASLPDITPTSYKRKV
jgi:hypothetical protein